MSDKNNKKQKKIILAAIPKEKEETFESTTGIKITCCGANEWSEQLSAIAGYDDSEIFVKLLKTIANPIRFRILLILLERDWACNCEFELAFGEHQTLISHHLRKLREADLITSTKKGQWKFYQIKDEAREFMESFKAILVKQGAKLLDKKQG